ncbi:phosphogluconate dehydrogenase (decarboxylating) gnd1, partial [Coemansia sp. RSA 2681]
LMPGGNPEAWPHLKPIFQAIAAKAPDGAACCDWVGEGGAGHFVKMVYHIFRDGVGFTDDEQSEIFAQWNKGVLDSFLIEISTDILRFKDADGQPLLEKIRDAAGQKGTGKWTAIAALDYGMPVTLIGEAVFSRCLSSIKDERVRASKVLSGPTTSRYTGDKAQLVKDLEQAMYASKIISYAQGFMLMREVSHQFKWNLNYGSIALMWRGGCIIRSAFLGDIKSAFDKNKTLECLLFDPFFQKATTTAQSGWRNAISTATLIGIPVPALSTALSFYDGYRTARLPANMLQAQRDYFGAHTYELEDKPGTYVHTNWTGRGGNVHASNYDA